MFDNTLKNACTQQTSSARYEPKKDASMNFQREPLDIGNAVSFFFFFSICQRYVGMYLCVLVYKLNIIYLFNSAWK